jgi:hypothetical protein
MSVKYARFICAYAGFLDGFATVSTFVISMEWANEHGWTNSQLLMGVMSYVMAAMCTSMVLRHFEGVVSSPSRMLFGLIGSSAGHALLAFTTTHWVWVIACAVLGLARVWSSAFILLIKTAQVIEKPPPLTDLLPFMGTHTFPSSDDCDRISKIHQMTSVISLASVSKSIAFLGSSLLLADLYYKEESVGKLYTFFVCQFLGLCIFAWTSWSAPIQRQAIAELKATDGFQHVLDGYMDKPSIDSMDGMIEPDDILLFSSEQGQAIASALEDDDAVDREREVVDAMIRVAKEAVLVNEFIGQALLLFSLYSLVKLTDYPQVYAFVVHACVYVVVILLSGSQWRTQLVRDPGDVQFHAGWADLEWIQRQFAVVGCIAISSSFVLEFVTITSSESRHDAIYLVVQCMLGVCILINSAVGIYPINLACRELIMRQRSPTACVASLSQYADIGKGVSFVLSVCFIRVFELHPIMLVCVAALVGYVRLFQATARFKNNERGRDFQVGVFSDAVDMVKFVPVFD